MGTAAVTRRPARRRPSRVRATARQNRRRRGWSEHLLSENRRFALSMLLGTIAGAALILLVPQTNYMLLEQRGDQLFALLLVLIVILTVYSVVFTLLTLLALRGQPRSRVVALARLGHVRRHVPLYKYLVGRSGPTGEVVQIMATAVVAIVLLALRPPEFAVALLLAFTGASLVTTWINTVLAFALEYAAVDAHGDAFDLPGTPPADRRLDEYLYVAVTTQAAPGPSGAVPLTRAARRLVRNHTVLAHTTSTIIITLAVSVVITALT